MASDGNRIAHQERLPHIIVIQFFNCFLIAYHQHGELIQYQEIKQIQKEHLLLHLLFFIELRHLDLKVG
jgi:hypothetical protein